MDLRCVFKKHREHFQDYQILIIFGTNISEKTCLQNV